MVWSLLLALQATGQWLVTCFRSVFVVCIESTFVHSCPDATLFLLLTTGKTKDMLSNFDLQLLTTEPYYVGLEELSQVVKPEDDSKYAVAMRAQVATCARPLNSAMLRIFESNAAGLFAWCMGPQTCPRANMSS